ncbi:DUF5667 domain-containing protein [Nocardioides speluncae]|uniref:DUF5667 domain-containing protein n=1 Tax=Nocardioides speluncae TaxID=2670337 RepID=UPI0012B17F81|nr:DUF5667 domain-containing protein [Nocardioides speluncae]
MTSLIPARRRAAEFDALVDGRTTGRHDARYGDLVVLVSDLKDLPDVGPRPEFAADLRAALMAEADTALINVDRELTLPVRRHSRGQRRLATAAAGIAIVGASTSMAVAAQSALPGDALYPIKRVLEDAQSGIRFSDEARGRAELENASARLSEVSDLSQRGTAAADARVPGTLDAFTEQAERGSELLLDEYAATGDTSEIGSVRTFVADSMATLEALDLIVPDRAHDELKEAARALTRIDDAARSACPTCEGPAALDLPLIFLTGASPDAPINQSFVTFPNTPGKQPTKPADTHPDAGGQPPTDEQPGPGDNPSDPDDPSNPDNPDPGLPTDPIDPDDPTGGLPQLPSNPVKDLTDAVVGDGDPSTPEDSPLATIVEGVGSTLGGLLGGLTGKRATLR